MRPPAMRAWEVVRVSWFGQRHLGRFTARTEADVLGRIRADYDPQAELSQYRLTPVAVLPVQGGVR